MRIGVVKKTALKFLMNDPARYLRMTTNLAFGGFAIYKIVETQHLHT